MAPRANWQGHLKLSLVSCAVALYPASSTRERVSFNTINRRTGHKVKRIYIDPETGEEVGLDDQVKGFATGKDQFVLVEAEELDAVRIESSHTIDIASFVPRTEIDPRFLETPYYIAPNDKVSQEAFAVIREAMRDAGTVGLGRVVVARRERIVMLEPFGRGLLGTLLRFSHEVREDDDYFAAIPDVVVPDEMRDLAKVIIARKAGHFEPARFNDRYEEALVALVRSKSGGEAAARPEAPADSNVVDLMEALRRSIGGGVGTGTGGASGAKPSKRTPPGRGAGSAADIPQKPAAASRAKAGSKATEKPASRSGSHGKKAS